MCHQHVVEWMDGRDDEFDLVKVALSRSAETCDCDVDSLVLCGRLTAAEPQAHELGTRH